MNATERLQEANARELREVNAVISAANERMAATRPVTHHELKIRAVSNFTPGAILAWFFTWTLCVVGFMAAMTLLTTLGKMLKLLVP